MDPALELGFRDIYNTGCRMVDEVHVMLLFALVIMRMVIIASGDVFTRGDFLLYCVPLMLASLGPMLQAVGPNTYSQLRPALLAGLRVAAALFRTTVTVCNFIPASKASPFPSLSMAGVLLLLASALLHPLEFRWHVPTHLLSLSIVIAGNAFLYAGSAPGVFAGSLNLPPLGWVLLQQYLFGYLVPTFLLFVSERAARKQFLYKVKSGSIKLCSSQPHKCEKAKG